MKQPAARPPVSRQGGLRAAFSFAGAPDGGLSRAAGRPGHPEVSWGARGVACQHGHVRDNPPMRETACHAAHRAALVGLLAALLNGAPAAWAQDGPRPVYRCPGPPVLYTDAITPEEARERNCRTIEGAAVTVVQAPPRHESLQCPCH